MQILVFSAWTEVLDLLSHSLHSSNILFCYGKEKAKRLKQLASFREQPEARVMLLQLKHAAAGLNIVEAQHALLMEPSTDPAVEAQVLTLHNAPVVRAVQLMQEKTDRADRCVPQVFNGISAMSREANTICWVKHPHTCRPLQGSIA